MTKRINSPCDRCILGKNNKYSHTASLGNPENAKLLIYLGSPTALEARTDCRVFGKGLEVLNFLLERTGISNEDVFVDWITACSNSLTKKDERLEAAKACSFHRKANLETQKTLKAVMLCGQIPHETLIQEPFRKAETAQGMCKELIEPINGITHAWTAYNPVYCYTNPSEIICLHRVLLSAAEQAGIRVKLTTNNKDFVWNDQ